MVDTSDAPEVTQAPDTPEVTFADTIGGLVSSATYNDANELVLPEGTSNEAAYATELTLQNTKSQRSLTASQQSVASLTAQNKVLEKKIQSLQAKGAFGNLSSDAKTRLTELKSSDPEAWRAEMDALEKKITTATDDDLKKELTTAGAKAIIAERGKVLSAYNAANPTAQITQEVIDKDIPERIKDKLGNNSIDFPAFLSEVAKYMAKGKKVSQPKVPKTVKFNGVGGANTNTKATGHNTDYENMTL